MNRFSHPPKTRIDFFWPAAASLCVHLLIVALLLITERIYYPPIGEKLQSSVLWMYTKLSREAEAAPPEANAEAVAPPSSEGKENVSPEDASPNEPDADPVPPAARPQPVEQEPATAEPPQEEPAVAMIETSRDAVQQRYSSASGPGEDAAAIAAAAAQRALELAAAERAAAIEKAAAEKTAAARTTALRKAAEKRAASMEKAAAEKATTKRAAALRKAAEERAVAMEIAAEKAAAEQAAIVRKTAAQHAAATEKAAAERATAERAAALRRATEERAAAMERAATEKAAVEKAATLRRSSIRTAAVSAGSRALPPTAGNVPSSPVPSQKKEPLIPLLADPPSPQGADAPPSPKAIFEAPLRGDVLVELSGKGINSQALKLVVYYREYPKNRHRRPMTAAEARRVRTVTPKMARIEEDTLQFVVETAADGIYEFQATSASDAEVKGKCVITLTEGGSKKKVRDIGLRRIGRESSVTKILMPERIVWEDDGNFSGSMEDAQSITKYNAESGLVWKEYK